MNRMKSVGAIILLSLGIMSFSGMLLTSDSWMPQGDAELVVIDCDTCFRLTFSQPGQLGCVWDHEPLDLSQGINLDFTLNFGSNDASGADGMSLVLSTMVDQCLGTGGDMGVAGCEECLILEFDTWDNGFTNGDELTSGDHTALYFSGNQTNPDFGPADLGNFPFNIEDDQFHDVSFTWNAGTMAFEVMFDGVSYLTGTMDLIDFFGTDMVFLGFTGSTGGFFNEHVVCPGIELNPPPNPQFVDPVIEVCAGETGVFYQATDEGGNYIWQLMGDGALSFAGPNATVDFQDSDVTLCVETEQCDIVADPTCINITVNPRPDVSVNDTFLCSNLYVLEALDIEGVQAGELISYHESESDANAGINSLTLPIDYNVSTVIWVRVENAQGCYTVLRHEVTVQPVEVSSNPAEGNLRICEGETYDLSSIVFSPTNGGSVIADIQWYNDVNNIGVQGEEISPIVDEQGTYFALVTLADGCQDILEFSLDVEETPVVDVPFQLIPCDGSPFFVINPGSAEWSYVWFDEDGNVISNEYQPIFTDPGDYSVFVSTPENCTYTDNFTLGLGPALLDIMITSDPLSCTVNQVTIDLDEVDPDWNYSWTGPGSFVSNQAEPTVDVSGEYELVVTTDIGCVDTLTHEVMLESGDSQVSVDDTSLDCNQDSVLVFPISPQDNASHAWINGQDTLFGDSVWISEPGEYILYALDDMGCPSIDTLTVLDLRQSPDYTIQSSDITCASDSGTILISAQEDYSYSWSGPNGFTSQMSSLTLADPGEYIVVVTGDNGCIASDTVAIASTVDFPAVQYSDTLLTCAIDTIEAFPSISSNVDSIVWTDPDGLVVSVDTLIIVSGGLYAIEVWTEDGCQAIDSFEVLVDQDRPAVVIVAGVITCNLPQASLLIANPSSSYEYEWTGPDGFMSAEDSNSVAIPGIYYINVIDTSNGCIHSDSIEVQIDTAHPMLILSAPDTLTCESPTVDLLATATPVPASIVWSDSAGTVGTESLISVSSPGWYFVEGTSTNGCIAIDSVLVIGDVDIPDVDIVGVDELDCATTSFTMSVEVSNADAQSEWILPDGQVVSGASLEVQDSGWYYVTVVSANGCEIRDSVRIESNVTDVEFDIVAEDLNCASPLGQAYVVDPLESWSIVWQSSELGNVMGDTVSYSTGSSITVTVTDTSNNCADTQELTISSDFYFPQIALSLSDFGCEDSVLMITATPDSAVVLEYEWTGPQGFSSDQSLVAVSTSGEYTLVVTNLANGCSDMLTVPVSLDINPILSLDLDVQNTSCREDNGAIAVAEITGGSAPYEYVLTGEVSESSVSGVFQDLSAGEYLLTVTDANGCPFEELVSIADSDLGFLTGPALIELQQGDSIEVQLQSSDPMASVMWSSSQVQCDTCLSTTLLGQQSETILISGLDSQGCPLEWSIQVVVSSPGVYIPNVFSPNNRDGINDVFFVRADDDSGIIVREVQIFNRWGGMVFHSQSHPPNNPQWGWDGTTQGKTQNPGVFIYRVLLEFPDGTTAEEVGDLTLL